MFNVHRAVLMEEVLDQYRDHGKEINGLKIAFEGEEGGGILVVLPNFCIQAIEKYCKGDNAVVPHLSPVYTTCTFVRLYFHVRSYQESTGSKRTRGAGVAPSVCCLIFMRLS